MNSSRGKEKKTDNCLSLNLSIQGYKKLKNQRAIIKEKPEFR